MTLYQPEQSRSELGLAPLVTIDHPFTELALPYADVDIELPDIQGVPCMVPPRDVWVVEESQYADFRDVISKPQKDALMGFIADPVGSAEDIQLVDYCGRGVRVKIGPRVFAISGGFYTPLTRVGKGVARLTRCILPPPGANFAETHPQIVASQYFRNGSLVTEYPSYVPAGGYTDEASRRKFAATVRAREETSTMGLKLPMRLLEVPEPLMRIAIPSGLDSGGDPIYAIVSRERAADMRTDQLVLRELARIVSSNFSRERYLHEIEDLIETVKQSAFWAARGALLIHETMGITHGQMGAGNTGVWRKSWVKSRAYWESLVCDWESTDPLTGNDENQLLQKGLELAIIYESHLALTDLVLQALPTMPDRERIFGVLRTSSMSGLFLSIINGYINYMRDWNRKYTEPFEPANHGELINLLIESSKQGDGDSICRIFAEAIRVSTRGYTFYWD